MNTTFPLPFKYAIDESKKSTFRVKVGACLVVGKSILKGHNKAKTHPKFANPQIHVRASLHAELDCFLGIDRDILKSGEIYVYREIDGARVMARPCNHCLKFLKEQNVTKIFYSISHFPFWDSEEI